MNRTYNFTEEQKQQIINDYVNNFLSYKDLKEKYDIRSNSKIEQLLKGYVRDPSERNKLAHQKHPESFKHSDLTKQKMRQARLQYMKEHPENTAWRKSNESYPEKQFEKFLMENGYSTKYLIEREYCMFPYFIDFAFVDLKIAIEIDGSQHLLKDRKQKDELKDKLLTNNGWKVIRLSENVVKTDWNLIKSTLDKFIDLKEETNYIKVGIIKSPKRSIREKAKRNELGLTEKQVEYYKRNNLKTNVDLPDKNILLDQILNNSFVAVGKMYNVTDNAIRKWCKRLGLPSKRSEINEYKKHLNNN